MVQESFPRLKSVAVKDKLDANRYASPRNGKTFLEGT